MALLPKWDPLSLHHEFKNVAEGIQRKEKGLEFSTTTGAAATRP